jgi:hypothetical protein
MDNETLNNANIIKRQIDYLIEYMQDLILVADDFNERQRIQINGRWIVIQGRYLELGFQQAIEDTNEIINDLKEKLNNL